MVKCQSINVNLESVSSILNDCDILLLQELLLANDNGILENKNINFNAVQVSTFRKSNQLYGSSSGGQAILWRKKILTRILPYAW